MNRQKLLRTLKFFLGWPISIVSLVFIFRVISPNVSLVWKDILSVNVPLLITGVILFQFFYFLRAYSWQQMLKEKGYNLKFIESAFYWELSEIKRFTPGNIWSFLARTFSFEKKGVLKKDVLYLIGVEIQLVIVSSLIVSLISIPFLLNLLKNFQYSNLVLGLSILLVFGLSTLFIVGNKIKKFSIFPNFSIQTNFNLLFYYVLSMFIFGISSYLLGTSFIYLNLSNILTFSSIFVFALIVGYLSLITPMGLGVREGVVLFSLAPSIGLAFAGVVSITTRIFLILSEILFLLIVTFLNYSKKIWTEKVEKTLDRYKQEVVLTILNLFYIIYFSVTSLLRHQKFFTGKFDLGNMDQVVWNTINGRFFLFTDPNGTSLVSRLSYHADFILAIISPLYLIWSDPRTLLILQTIILSLGSVFVFLIAKKVLNNKTLALLFSFIYLINPAVVYTNLYDFHPVTLATTFLLASFYSMIQKKYLLFSLFAILSAFCKEQIWLIVGLMGLFIFLKEKTYKKTFFKKTFGLLVFIVSFGMFYYLIWYAIPKARGGDHFALSYYSEFGASPSDIVKNVILSPFQTLSLVFEKSRLEYLNILFFPLGFLSFASPLFLIFALPDFAISLLSNNPQLRQIYYQYSATITPFVFISAIYGMRFLRKKIKKITFPLAFYLGAMSILSFYLYSPFPGSRNPNIAMFTQSVSNKKIINESLLKIPPNASVAATNNLGSHLSQRENIYTIPVGTQNADFVVFLLNDWYAQPSLETQKEMARNMEHDRRYKLLVKDGLFVLFEKTPLK